MWSRWSHSALYDDVSGYVYDSALLQGGVKKCTLAEWEKNYPSKEMRPLVVHDRENAIAWLEEQVGKKYDFTALIAFPFRENWQNEDKWFCSELTESFRNKFSTPIFRTTANRITPHHEDIVS